MTRETRPPVQALELGRAFFEEEVRPAMERLCPGLLQQAACGRFGYGSECLGMDDAISRDHHWGPQVDILLPDELGPRRSQELLRQVSAVLPARYRGFELQRGPVGSAGLAPEPLPGFLRRTIGRTTAPETVADWLDMPEEDIVHVTNGEVWHDPRGEFSALRRTLQGYYPDLVWRRRIAHWCRYCSGMGLYPIQRALLRGNACYAFTAFGRLLKRTLELAFLLNRTYFPYDKWLYPLFRRLPALAPEMDPLIEQAVRPETSWEQRVRLCERLHDLLDARMVELGLIRPHPRFARSQTSGYRILEHAYGELCQSLPPGVVALVPRWDQTFMEEFHSGFVAGLSLQEWDRMLNLEA